MSQSFSPCYRHLFIHPLCALSASESLVAPRLLFSGTFQGTWLVSGQRTTPLPGALFAKTDFVSTSIHSCCCLCVFEKISMAGLLHCVRARGCL